MTIQEKRTMYKSRKKLTVLCDMCVFLGMWMILSVHCRVAETDNDETQTNEQKIIRVGSFEDTFDYVDKNGVRRGYGYELMQALTELYRINLVCEM